MGYRQGHIPACCLIGCQADAYVATVGMVHKDPVLVLLHPKTQPKDVSLRMPFSDPLETSLSCLSGRSIAVPERL